MSNSTFKLSDWDKRSIIRAQAAQLLDDYGVDAFNQFAEKNPNAIPCRIRRKRTKGFKTPANTVYVGRGSAWGNPYFLDNGQVKLHTAKGIWIEGAGDINIVVAMFKQRIERRISEGDVDISQLRGKNLSCWCGVNDPCHADVLLELANKDLQ